MGKLDPYSLTCICTDTPLSALPTLASGCTTLEDVQRKTGCGAYCGLCLTYVGKVLGLDDR